MRELEITSKLIPVLKQQGVRRAAIFGSFARGEETPESDVDLLVELDEGKSLLDLVRLKISLEETLGRRVDVTTPRSLHPKIREQALKDAVAVL